MTRPPIVVGAAIKAKNVTFHAAGADAARGAVLNAELTTIPAVNRLACSIERWSASLGAPAESPDVADDEVPERPGGIARSPRRAGLARRPTCRSRNAAESENNIYYRQ